MRLQWWGSSQKGEETAYREEVKALADHYAKNNLILNPTKTKELIVDFRKKVPDPIQPIYIMGEEVERVSECKFLGVNISSNMTWKSNTTALQKKGLTFVLPSFCSDGSLSTKQILFLQRPVLQRRRKDFKLLTRRGRHRTKKHASGEMLEEGEDRSLVLDTQMDTLRRAGDQQADGLRTWSGEEGEGHADRDRPFLSGSLPSLGEREEETDVDGGPAARKTVTWTDVCRGGGGVRADVKMERVRHQLFSGVC
ncbi:uncharacterized protein LOC133636384 [Entelurus aequoreus]|uniref:uncharacterized protein LOC133636384 n=1 Tax=Entelurus aequoreus TaxID=161455 RepID=UPI002B1CF0FE|nr:uncharacterized protein LOC133636384 [Entelurus aequoreus]